MGRARLVSADSLSVSGGAEVESGVAPCNRIHRIRPASLLYVASTNAADGAADKDKDGYTNLEEFLHPLT